MSITIRKIAPTEIEAESFRIIAAELGPHDFDPSTFKVVQRVIHATGDFNFAVQLRFHPQALSKAMAAIRAGKHILADVNMVAAGVNKGMLAGFGGEVRCLVADPEVARIADADGGTRAEAAIAKGLEAEVGIIAIGNAPTALLKAMECLDHMAPARQPLVVGVPVGFVNAAEAKALLARKEYPFITSLGRKGGSPVAAAICNGLIRLAAEV